MDRSYFLQVKEAFAGNLDSSLRALGIDIKKGGTKGWQAIACPCCSDTNGSASIAMKTGHLVCHQCGRKLDLFEWYAEQHGGTTWDAAKAIGALLGIPFAPAKKKKGREVQRMTPAFLDRAIIALLEDPAAEPARRHLKDRNLFDPQMLAKFGVGFFEGSIIFAQFHPNGDLRKRFRFYAPMGPMKWRWSKGPGGPIGFWPYYELPDDAEILICEGEMDTMTAWKLLKLHRRGVPIIAFTWTGGGGVPVASSLMPDSWAGRKVWIVYDNDIFQGPDVKTHKAPDARGLRDLLRRRDNLINGVAAKFEANGCDVSLLAIPMDPIDHFGSDLRDWAAADKTFDDLPHWKLDELKDSRQAPEQISHAEVFTAAGKYIKTTASVATIEQNTLTVPSESRIICPMDKPCCAQCKVPKIFPDQHIDWKLHREDLLAGLVTQDFNAYAINNTLCKPKACNECKLEHDVYWNGSWWTASAGEVNEGDGTEFYHVVSTERPSLSGDVGITGYAYHVGKSIGVFATQIEQLDKPMVNLEEIHHDLISLTPWASKSHEAIDQYLDEMVHDYTHNVTKIYGRPEIHLGTLLVAHSALWYNIDGHKFRGWLDACFFGETRQGKSETIKRIFEHLRLGNIFTCMDNFSRAGLTVGGAESGSRMRPGLWPKNNRKMLFLDEFHNMTNGPMEKNVMVHLQSARDEGKVSALKVYGDMKLPAAVRLITAGNWSNRNRRHFQYFCQHLLSFYGVPEALSRLDFAWCVYGPVKMKPEDVEHKWTSEIARALILRAWAMEPHQVHLDPNAIKMAKQACIDWDPIYASEELPLHTGVEKYHCIIRIAIAVANICYSHPSGKPRECEVREVHVAWAIAWILKCWANLQYDEFSQRVVQAKTVTQPYHVEAMFTVQLDLGDPDHAMVMLSRLSEANNLRSLMNLVLGNGQVEEPRHFNKWLGMMQRCSAIQEKSENFHNVSYVPTEGALAILRKLIHSAKTDPEGYQVRYKEIDLWFGSPEVTSTSPHGLEPLDDTEPEEFYDEVPF